MGPTSKISIQLQTRLTQRMFESRKQNILAGLADTNPDASPKGSVDVEIIPLVNLFNAQQGVVTTSSCAGRISVFIEGMKKGQQDEPKIDDNLPMAMGITESVTNSPLAGIGGKGLEGRWFFVSHRPVSVETIPWGELGPSLGSSRRLSEFVISEETRFIHFKFEPMILHVMTSTLDLAQKILKIALSSGFRESGIMSAAAPPTVAIRSTGLALDSIIGFVDPETLEPQKTVDDAYLNTLVQVSQIRFKENERRRELLFKRIEDSFSEDSLNEKRPGWEEKKDRQERLRREGLQRKAEAEKARNKMREESMQTSDAEVFWGVEAILPS